jgi:hypothetical protein
VAPFIKKPAIGWVHKQLVVVKKVHPHDWDLYHRQRKGPGIIVDFKSELDMATAPSKESWPRLARVGEDLTAGYLTCVGGYHSYPHAHQITPAGVLVREMNQLASGCSIEPRRAA